MNISESVEFVRLLKEALMHAFNEPELRELVKFGLKENLDEITKAGTFSERTFQLVEWADRRGRLDELYQAALAKNPNNPGLKGLGPPKSVGRWNHRMNIVPSIWKAKWTATGGRLIEDRMQIHTWIGENEFRGHGFSEHGTMIYNYSFNGHIEPVGVILLEYRAERYPVAGAKNVGVATLEIKDENTLVGFWAGYKDARQPEQREHDRLTYPEVAVASDKFYIPPGRMTYDGGTVEMRLAGHGD
jgi:hypothetical protein